MEIAGDDLTHATPVPGTTRSSRNWCFTLFYYVWENITLLLALQCRGIIFQEEMCPQTNRPHLQGFIRFNRALRMDEIKDLLGEDMQHIHLEMARAPAKAIEYCRKGETRFGECYEEGDLSFQQGKSSELADCYDLIAQGASYREIVQQYPLQCILHPNGIRFARDYSQEPDTWRDVKVYAITGPSGAGKTRAVYKHFSGIYKMPRPSTNGVVWFGSYDGHETLLIDDFYGWIAYSQLLHILDGYPLECEIKGGFQLARWKNVVITSNTTPHDWYSSAFPNGCPPALARRIHHWIRPVEGEPEEFFTFELISNALAVEPCPYGPPLPRGPTAVSRNWNEPFRPPRRVDGLIDLSLPSIPLSPRSSVPNPERSPIVLGPGSAIGGLPVHYAVPRAPLTNVTNTRHA